MTECEEVDKCKVTNEWSSWSKKHITPRTNQKHTDN